MNIDPEERAPSALPCTAEERFRLIVRGLPAIVAVFTTDGQLAYANRQMLDYFGETFEGLKRLAPTQGFHPDDRAEVDSLWTESLKSGLPCDFEARLRRADGAYRWFYTRGLPLRDAADRVVLWYMLKTDIDDRRRAEALLDGEKRLFEMLASGCPLADVLSAICALLDATAEGCLSNVLVLDGTRTRVGYVVGPGLPYGYNASLLGRPFNCAEGPCGMTATLKTQVVVSDVRSDKRWGSDGWPATALAHGLQSCWSTPILSATGELLGTFAIYQRQAANPTPFHQTLIRKFTHIASIAIERWRSEDALRRSEATLREAQHLSSTGSFCWHVPSNAVTWSEETYNIFELDRTVPLTPDAIRTRIHPEDIPQLDGMVDQSRREGIDFQNHIRLQMPDGRIKYLHVVSRTRRDGCGGLEYIGAVKDITERRVSEQTLGKVRAELARVARVTSLGALTASIAHEVNQPLAGIVTNASACLEMLAADPADLEGARATAHRTIRDANRACDVSTRLRALFSKKSATGESVNLNEATREVTALLLSELRRNRVVLDLELAEDLPRVKGDRVQLQQVILNLVLNASEAMCGIEDRPRELMIKTTRDEKEQVRLSVQDAGVGFKAQESARLFEAFYTTKSGGMGMGLSVSRSIIESHRGRLWATPNDGPGATFTFSLPDESALTPVVDSLGGQPWPAVVHAGRAFRSS